MPAAPSRDRLLALAVPGEHQQRHPDQDGDGHLLGERHEEHRDEEPHQQADRRERRRRSPVQPGRRRRVGPYRPRYGNPARTVRPGPRPGRCVIGPCVPKSTRIAPGPNGCATLRFPDTEGRGSRAGDHQASSAVRSSAPPGSSCARPYPGGSVFRKVLVANRGEIAIRAFRAAYELGVATVAVFPYEDRNSVHRLKADEAYQIGERGHPVRAYLDVDEIVAAARAGGRRRGLPRLRLPVGEPRSGARPAPTPGITFIGPPADVLHLTGNKARAIAAAREAGRAGAGLVGEPSADVDALVAAADERRLPAVRQGGRGRRRPRHAPGRRAGRRCARPSTAAMREAESAFGDPTVFLEQAVVDPRHIEVQILADADGQRHPPLRARLLGAAPPPEGRSRSPRRRTSTRSCGTGSAPTPSRSPAHIGYVNAGTVEFLLDERGQPRLHRDEPAHPGRAHGHRGGHRRRPGASPSCGSPPARPWPTWTSRRTRCAVAAPRCSAGSPPRTRPTASGRTPAGSSPTARRAAPASGSTAAPRTPAPRSAPHFDSLLVKLTCRGRDLRAGRPPGPAGARRVPHPRRRRRTSRSCSAVLDDPDFRGRPASPPASSRAHRTC